MASFICILWVKLLGEVGRSHVNVFLSTTIAVTHSIYVLMVYVSNQIFLIFGRLPPGCQKIVFGWLLLMNVVYNVIRRFSILHKVMAKQNTCVFSKFLLSQNVWYMNARLKTWDSQTRGGSMFSTKKVDRKSFRCRCQLDALPSAETAI